MNYADLFRATLPETVLEITALLVLIADLGFLRKASFKTRVINASFLGVAGCLMAIWGVYVAGNAGFSVDGELLLSAGSIAGVAQVGILALTAITLLLLVGEEFTKHVGEYVAVVLMAAAGGLIISAAQDLLVIFIGLELLSLGLYILTAFAKKSGKSAEAAMKYYPSEACRLRFCCSGSATSTASQVPRACRMLFLIWTRRWLMVARRCSI